MPTDDPFTSPSEVRTPPPAIGAVHPGECSDCGYGIYPGDTIRADGDGDWIHEECYRAIARAMQREHRDIERQALSAD